MLAEENKNSGRSALDGECKCFRSVITQLTPDFYSCNAPYSIVIVVVVFIIKQSLAVVNIFKSAGVMSS